MQFSGRQGKGDKIYFLPTGRKLFCGRPTGSFFFFYTVIVISTDTFPYIQSTTVMIRNAWKCDSYWYMQCYITTFCINCTQEYGNENRVVTKHRTSQRTQMFSTGWRWDFNYTFLALVLHPVMLSHQFSAV